MFDISLPSAYDKSNFLVKSYFIWMWKFLYINRKRSLTVNVLHKCPKYDQSGKLCEKLEAAWEEELRKQEKGGEASLFRAIAKVFWLYFLWSALMLLASQAIAFYQTLILGYLVNALNAYSVTEERDEIRTEIYYYAAGICVSQFIFSLLINPYFWHTTRIGMDIRIACCSLIYRKSLRLSKSAFAQTTVGQIINFLSNDVNRFDLAPNYPAFILVGICQVIASFYILWPLLGYSLVFGVCVLVLYIPLQALLGKLFSKLRGKAAVLTDERVRLMNEFIPAMRVIKMYAWEKPFAKLINQARKAEVKKIRNSALLRGLNLTLFFVSAKLIIFGMLVIYVLLGQHLSAATVFVAISLINQLRLSVTLFTPFAVATCAEAGISIKRIKKFLLLPEMKEQSSIERSSFISKSFEPIIAFTNVHATWFDENSKQEPALKNLTLQADNGKLTTILGPVGSGKSSILMTVLGEMSVIRGKAVVHGRISYAAQEPWTFAGTVRENILFNLPYEQSKYNRVVKVCALERDFTLFPAGDRTFVGDRGVSLSGGQRARINLARCLYREADVYLLDDPLSAVDASVAKHIFNKAIKEYLKQKLVILVTHQLQFAKSADKIVLMKDGQVYANGAYADLLNAGIDFVKFGNFAGVRKDSLIQRRKSSITSLTDQITGSDPMGSNISLSSSVFIEADDNKQSTSIKQVQFDCDVDETNNEEHMSKAADARTYWMYIKLGGVMMFIAFNFTQVFSQFFFLIGDWWLSEWTDSEERAHNTAFNASNETKTFIDKLTQEQNIYILSGQNVLMLVFALFRTVTFFVLCMRTSVNLHDRLFKSVVRAPISFFDNNPIGILLNRCSRDMGIIDDILPATAFDALNILSADLGITILIGYIDFWILLPSTILLVVFYFIRKLYVGVARDIKRLEGITKSPVFSHLSTSLYGLSSIRAFNSQRRFEMKFDQHQDAHTSAWFFYIGSSRWFVFILDCICVAYVSSITISLVLNLDSMNGSKVGLAISSAFIFTGGFQWGIRQLTEMETQMTSVERVNEYSTIEPEAELESLPERKPPSNWPHSGKITFENVSLRYAPEKPPVLVDLNFTINGQEKIGIVGRTGAGKSSIIAALFRLTECTGNIVIDSYITRFIGLHDLRKKISIIPQDPILFSGSIRYNLDPFNEKSDEQLWNALQQVQLGGTINAMPDGLDSAVNDGGTNFSVGQRQLICLARAILRGNRILVLDEATANVDPKTDSLIQQTIRNVFSDCTILTIAHRLHTVMDSDKILVLDAGMVQEFDEPYLLLQNETGALSSMVQATGKEMSENLRKMAKIAYEAKTTGTGSERKLINNLYENIIKENHQQSYETFFDESSGEQITKF